MDGGLALELKIKTDELTAAKAQVAGLTAQVNGLNDQVGNLKGQISNADNAIAIQNNAIAQLKADSDAEQVQLTTLAKNLNDLQVKEASTVKALQAATAPKNVSDAITYLQTGIEGVLTWQATVSP